MVDDIRREYTVRLPAEQAFATFVDDFSRWWPREYTWSGDVIEWIGPEPRLGGRCFERGPHGFQCDWGRVLAWEPPHRTVFTWQIGFGREPVPDPARASEIEVRFEPADPGSSRFLFEHRGFDRHGAKAADYRAALDSDTGWDLILGRYVQATGRHTGDNGPHQ
jgi:uncharacterized protein YndB with AHSA1/START domain